MSNEWLKNDKPLAGQMGDGCYDLPATRRVVHCKRERFDVYVGRPSKWGNPFKLDADGDRKAVIAKYRAWLMGQPELVAAAKAELRGKVLGCWCAPLACHGDVLAEIAG